MTNDERDKIVWAEDMIRNGHTQLGAAWDYLEYLCEHGSTDAMEKATSLIGELA